MDCFFECHQKRRYFSWPQLKLCISHFCSGYNHSTLYINNINRGPAGDTNTIDYTDLSEEEGHTWILPTCSGKHGVP